MLKTARRCGISDFIIVWIFESMFVVGQALLVFVVFPELDVVKGAMLTNCLAFLPGLFGENMTYLNFLRCLINIFFNRFAIQKQ